MTTAKSCRSRSMNHESESETQTPDVEMTLTDLDRYLTLFEELGITVWLGGGWGVDALLGAQTRRHADLDIVLEGTDSRRLRQALLSLGFADVYTEDRSAWNFVMADRQGNNRIDFHVVEFDNEGRGIYGPPRRGDFFPASSFQGRGIVNHRPVHCLDAEFQMQSHTGYEIDEDDIHDMMAMHERFGLPLPAGLEPPTASLEGGPF